MRGLKQYTHAAPKALQLYLRVRAGRGSENVCSAVSATTIFSYILCLDESRTVLLSTFSNRIFSQFDTVDGFKVLDFGGARVASRLPTI